MTYHCVGLCRNTDLNEDDFKHGSCWRCGGKVEAVKSYVDGTGGIVDYGPGIPVSIHGAWASCSTGVPGQVDQAALMEALKAAIDNNLNGIANTIRAKIKP